MNIFYLFSQAENYVKEVVADRVVLKRMRNSLLHKNFADPFQVYSKIFDG